MDSKLNSTLETIKSMDIIFHAEIKAVNDEERIIEGWASTEDIDRINDIVKAKAFKGTIKEFMKNPVLTFMHDLRSPVGSIKEAKIVPGKGLFVKAFVDTTEENLWQKVKQGTIRAFSFGFKTISSHEEKIKDVTLRIIDELELLEIALVSVPMNRQALFSAVKAFEREQGTDLICEGGCKDCGKCLENYKNDMISSYIHEWVEEKFNAEEYSFEDGKLIVSVEGFRDDSKGTITGTPYALIEKLEDVAKHMALLIESKAVVPFKKYPLAPINMAWSFTAADGNAILGDPPNFNRFKTVHTWFDPENDETRAGFKLPHHKTIGGQLQTVWRGVVAAWARRRTANIPSNEMPGVESHLQRHASEFDRTLGGRSFWEQEIKEAIVVHEEIEYLNEVIKIGIQAEMEAGEIKESESLLTEYKSLLTQIEAENKIWEETENEFRNRLKDPSLFKEGSFRRITLQRTKPRVFAVVGRLQGKTTTALQSLRFPKEDDWTLSKAKTWVKDHPNALKQLEEVEAKNMQVINFIQPEEVITEYAYDEGSKSWNYTVMEDDNFTPGSRVRQFKVTATDETSCTFSEIESIYQPESEKVGREISSKNKKRINSAIGNLKAIAEDLERFMADHNGGEPAKEKDKANTETGPSGAESDEEKDKQDVEKAKLMDISDMLESKQEIEVTELSEETQTMLSQLNN